jgi:hypothetical protein
LRISAGVKASLAGFEGIIVAESLLEARRRALTIESRLQMGERNSFDPKAARLWQPAQSSPAPIGRCSEGRFAEENGRVQLPKQFREFLRVIHE